MIEVDFLIIGQGIAGTLLSHELLRLGKKVMVIDASQPNKSSLVAGAVLNPMAGKHWSPAPLAQIFLPKAIEAYRQIEVILQTAVLSETCLNVFHESNEKRVHFEKQRNAFPQYFEAGIGINEAFFNHEFGCGTIKGLYQVNAEKLLSGWKQHLIQNRSFSEGTFDFQQIQILAHQIRYQNVVASKIIFCTGAEAAELPIFQYLPFTKNRGEALLVSIPDLPFDAIYHKHLRLVPKGNGLFWCGSNYVWNFEDLEPNLAWKANAEKDLKEWLKLPFKIEDHIVAQRPTTAGQIPIVGMHPQIGNVAILNGLGTRGFSSGPFWAGELAKHLLDGAYQIPHINHL